MNFIACTDNCIYQKEGECTLDRAVSHGQSCGSSCAYCIPKCETAAAADNGFKSEREKQPETDCERG